MVLTIKNIVKKLKTPKMIHISVLGPELVGVEEVDYN